jgi:hypothetical protein
MESGLQPESIGDSDIVTRAGERAGIETSASPDEVLRRLAQDLAFLLQFADLLRRAAFSASNGVGAFDRRPRGRLAPAARTQLRRVSGLIPRSAATCRIVASGRDWYSATASALNCGG